MRHPATSKSACSNLPPLTLCRDGERGDHTLGGNPQGFSNHLRNAGARIGGYIHQPRARYLLLSIGGGPVSSPRPNNNHSPCLCPVNQSPPGSANAQPDFTEFAPGSRPGSFVATVLTNRSPGSSGITETESASLTLPDPLHSPESPSFAFGISGKGEASPQPRCFVLIQIAEPRGSKNPKWQLSSGPGSPLVADPMRQLMPAFQTRLAPMGLIITPCRRQPSGYSAPFSHSAAKLPPSKRNLPGKNVFKAIQNSLQAVFGSKSAMAKSLQDALGRFGGCLDTGRGLPAKVKHHCAKIKQHLKSLQTHFNPLFENLRVQTAK